MASDTEQQALTQYFLSLTRKHSDLRKDLDELCLLTNERALSRHEYHSAERLLQVLIESCVGIAKRWVKKLGFSFPDSAYLGFSTLAKLSLINDQELAEWRRIIGLRNALVHDYLNIDTEIIKKVLSDKVYLICFDFAKKAKQAILEEF